ELQYAEALEQTRKHEAALASARQLPERYQPQMPPRTALDVRRDFDVLQQGGEAAERLMRQMGVTTPEEASAVLGQEARRVPEAADIWRQASQPRPRGSQPPTTQAPPADVPEIQKFVRDLGGIQLAGEPLANEWQSVIQPRQVGRRGVQPGLLNNQTGKTLQ